MARLLSILVPMYNESEVIPVFFEAINKVLAGIGMDYEIICVNDGSKDNTLELLSTQAARDPRVKVVSFSRNFGKEPAMTAALDYAAGDAAIPMDADLQDPPELIYDMLRKWNEGFDVVYAKRSSRASDSLIKRTTAHWFYNLFNRLSEVDIPESVGDYRLMSRRVIDVIRKLPEKERFMKGLFCWPGFKTTMIEFERQVRAGGSTKFNYWKLWNFALNGITSFSTIPIRLGIYLGLFIATLAFIYGFYITVKTLVLGVDEPGYASLMVVVLFLGGVQLFCFGLMGEYIGRIYKEVKNRPLYVVEQAIGFDGQR
jgi:polyisoprenyl-phosphate glycosyltransferase